MKRQNLKIFTVAILISITIFNFWALSTTHSETLNPKFPIPESFSDGVVQKTVNIDSSKIYQPDLGKSSSTEKLPASATVKILESEKSLSPKKSPQTANPISAGLNYLVQNQAADGSWSHNGKIKSVETAAVVELLTKLNQRVGASTSEQQQIDLIYPKALDWLRLSFPENSDYLAEKVAVLSEAGDDMTDSMDFLSSQINESGLGFGQQKKYGADIVTTAKILEAVSITNYQDSGSDPQLTAKAALLYLLYSQNTDGGWPELVGEQSALYTTNIVLESLFPYQSTIIQGIPGGDTIIPAKSGLALKYLKNHQYTFNGSWQDNFLNSALSYNTIISYGVEPQENQKAIDYLKNFQNSDGSFSTPGFFKTTKALEALAKPDLVVSNIENPISVPNPNEILRVTIRNDGYLTSNPINLAAAPSGLHLKIDNQNITLDLTSLPPTIILEPNSELVLELHFNQALFGNHIVNFQIDYPGVEFWKNNNNLNQNLAFGSSQFNGPIPPPWIGASTYQDPDSITLRWQQSSDPTRSYYALYGSTISGQYDPGNPLYIFSPGNFAGITFYFDDPSLQNIPLYFSIVSFDSSGNRGNYSPESWAVAYPNPENYRGTLSGSVKDSRINQKVPNTEIDFYLIDTFYSDGAGDYSINYYPGFYLATVWKQDYSSYNGFIQISAQLSTSTDFIIRSASNSTYPPTITGLRGVAGDHQITLNWDTYSPPSDFKRFNIYRSNQQFGSVGDIIPLASISDPAATSFDDASVTNGINYFYSAASENLSGNIPDVGSIGPFRANSAPIISNLAVAQSGPNVDFKYDLADAENNPLSIFFQYWDGNLWRDIQNAVGEGSQDAGLNKIGIWNAKLDFPNFQSQSKIKVIVSDGQSVNATTASESDLFSLDTKNPSPPTITNYKPITSQQTEEISGSKEVNSSIFINGSQVVSSTITDVWSAFVNLSLGANNFSITDKDLAGNESTLENITITRFDNNFVCGDADSDGSINVGDVVFLVQYIFGGGPAPVPLIAGDADSDGSINIADAVFLINYIFSHGSAPCNPPATYSSKDYNNWTSAQFQNYLDALSVNNEATSLRTLIQVTESLVPANQLPASN